MRRTAHPVMFLAFTVLAATACADEVSDGGAAQPDPVQQDQALRRWDRIAPTTPTNVVVSSVTASSADLSWGASTDNRGVTSYIVTKNGVDAVTVTTTHAALTGLACASSYSLGVVALDAAGNRSGAAKASVTTAACSGSTPPPSTSPSSSPSSSPTPPPPPTPTGNVITLSGTVTPAAFDAAVAAAAPGPLSVQPAAGATSFAVSGTLDIQRPGLAIRGAKLAGTITFEPGSDGSSFMNGAAMGFYIMGADDITVRGNAFDGQGIVNQNLIWDQPAGATPDRFRVEDNSFKHFYDASDPTVHSEALYIGYSKDGLVQNNTFDDNGNTSHIFFTWFGNQADPSSSYPTNICVRGNTFGATHGAYYAVNLREEIPASTNIAVEAPPSNTLLASVGFITNAAMMRPCQSPLAY